MGLLEDDRNLLLRFRAGEHEALAQVYWLYVESVEALLRHGLARARRGATAARSFADVADLVQEVFVKAFGEAARSSYDGLREYRPFLLSIARNTLIDHLRQRGGEVSVDPVLVDAMGESNGPQALEDSSYDDPHADPQTLLVVDQYVAGLAATEKAVYVQRYVMCRSQLDAAQELNISRQRLRTIEGRLRKGLARELARMRLRSSASPNTKSQPTVSTIRNNSSATLESGQEHGP